MNLKSPKSYLNMSVVVLAHFDVILEAKGFKKKKTVHDFISSPFSLWLFSVQSHPVWDPKTQKFAAVPGVPRHPPLVLHQRRLPRTVCFVN